MYFCLLLIELANSFRMEFCHSNYQQILHLQVYDFFIASNLLAFCSDLLNVELKVMLMEVSTVCVYVIYNNF